MMMMIYIYIYGEELERLSASEVVPSPCIVFDLLNDSPVEKHMKL